MISAQSYATGDHFFRLESGKWVDYPHFHATGLATDPSGVVIGRDDDGIGLKRFWNPDGRNADILACDKMDHYDREYYRDTGEIVWTTLVGSATKATYTIKRTVFKPSANRK